MNSHPKTVRLARLLFLCAWLVAADSAARAVTIVSFAFNASSATPTFTLPGVAATAISTNGSMSISNTSPVSSGYTGASGSFYASDNGWGSTGNFFQFSLTPDVGESLVLASLSFGYRLSTTTGPT